MKKRTKAKRKPSHGWTCMACGHCGPKNGKHCGRRMKKY